MAAVEKLRQADWRAMSRNARQSFLDGWRWADQAKRYEHLFLTLRQASPQQDRLCRCRIDGRPASDAAERPRGATKSLRTPKTGKTEFGFEWKLRPTAGLSGTKRSDSPLCQYFDVRIQRLAFRFGRCS
jgi:hypothetical protein